MSSKSRETLPPSPIAGRYIVERVLGRGGMATVYLCTDNKTATKVAVKVLREEVGSAVIVERFLREIEFASELDHPRIPKVLDTGVLGSLPFYVMTYVEGESLRERLDRVKQLPVDEAVRITSAVIEPMTYAHRVGLVHRDIKPGNILVGDESVYVLDFGIARAIIASAEERLTSTGVAVGTPAYMSPEQALADGDLDARSDIYSLACVTYEMIAGIPPFVGATPQAVMARRFGSPPPPLNETREGVPQHVETAVSKALCRAPADRWQTAREFGDALQTPTATQGDNRVQQAVGDRRKKYGRIIAAIVAIALAGVALFAVILGQADPITRAQRAVADWDFDRAEQELTQAAKDDNPEAHLWLAQVLLAKDALPTEWTAHALSAADAKATLAKDDSLFAEALVAHTNQARAGCGRWEALATSNSEEFRTVLATLAYADCLRLDKTVINDASSASGYRFRSSHDKAAKLYEGLIARNSSNPNAYAAIIPRLLEILPTEKNNALRIGNSLADEPEIFVSFPSLASDTLAYVPYRIGRQRGPLRAEDPRSFDRAIARNLASLRAHGLAWVAAAGNDARAHEMLGLVLESTGILEGDDNSARAHVAHARRIASRSESSADSYMRDLRLAISDIRLRLKLSQFDAAGALADSVLNWKPAQLDDSAARVADDMLSGVAALTGRPSRIHAINRKYSAEYPVELSSGEEGKLPPEVGTDANALLTYGLFGGPADSIATIADRLSLKLAALYPKADFEVIRSGVLRRPLALATPAIGPERLGSLGAASDHFDNAVRGLHAGNMRMARAYVDSLTSLRSENAPGEITMDAVLQHAWLLTAVGDDNGAMTLLDNAFRGISKMPANTVEEAPVAASLVRSMILRAQLAVKHGDTNKAAEWSRAAQALWGRGDPSVRSQLAAAARQ